MHSPSNVERPKVIGYRYTPSDRTEIAFRLSAPLQDHAPAVRNVMLRIDSKTGAERIHPCRAFQLANGEWSALRSGSWIACYNPLAGREEIFARDEIARARRDLAAKSPAEMTVAELEFRASELFDLATAQPVTLAGNRRLTDLNNQALQLCRMAAALKAEAFKTAAE